jgi:hypothetical protein
MVLAHRVEEVASEAKPNLPWTLPLSQIRSSKPELDDDGGAGCAGRGPQGAKHQRL